jgi:hypothetical protein
MMSLEWKVKERERDKWLGKATKANEAKAARAHITQAQQVGRWAAATAATCAV